MSGPIVLSGYYGFGNAGDEAVLAGLIQGLRDGRPDIAIDVLSMAPEQTRATRGVDAAHRYRIGPLLRSLGRAGLLISGGGSLLQDVTSAHGIFYYAAVVRIAQMLGKPTMFAAQGIGPLVRPRSRRLVAGIANRLDAITVRDPESKDLLVSIGVRRSIEVTADPALLLGSSLRGATPAARSGRAAVSLRPWPSTDGGLVDRLVHVCHALPGLTGVAALAMQPGSDSGEVERFRTAYRQHSGREAVVVAAAADGDRLPAIIEALGSSDIVVGMRLHALILAAGAGVPAAAIAYDPKVTSFMRSTGQEDAVARVDSAADCAAVVEKIWAERQERAARLSERLPALRAAARRNADVALSLIPG
ncbi:MAG: polysaccharide pyruvyl transferase CsaB [Capsulimonadaceae bacterium]